jgi:hypothetical protein
MRKLNEPKVACGIDGTTAEIRMSPLACMLGTEHTNTESDKVISKQVAAGNCYCGRLAR